MVQIILGLLGWYLIFKIGFIRFMKIQLGCIGIFLALLLLYAAVMFFLRIFVWHV